MTTGDRGTGGNVSSNLNRQPTLPLDNVRSITSHQVSRAVLESQQQQKFSDIINLNQDEPGNGWNAVTYKKKRRNNTTMVGTGVNGLDDSTCLLKAAPNLFYCHIYQLDPMTSEEDLASYLKTMFKEASCVKLESKYPDRYASFKVGIYEKNVESLLRPTIWPEGTKINRFFHLKKRKVEKV